MCAKSKGSDVSRMMWLPFWCTRVYCQRRHNESARCVPETSRGIFMRRTRLRRARDAAGFAQALGGRRKTRLWLQLRCSATRPRYLPARRCSLSGIPHNSRHRPPEQLQTPIQTYADDKAPGEGRRRVEAHPVRARRRDGSEQLRRRFLIETA